MVGRGPFNRYTTSAYFNNVGGAWKKANERDGGSYEDNLDRATRRHIDDSHRYMELYGIDLNDMSPTLISLKQMTWENQKFWRWF